MGSFYDFTVGGPEDGIKDVHVKIDSVVDAVKYQFEILRLDSKGVRGQPSLYDSHTPDYKIGLSPGTWEIRLRTFFSDETISDWGPPWRFYVPYAKPTQYYPRAGSFIDPKDEKDNTVELVWEGQPDVTYYRVYVYLNGRPYKTYKSETAKTKIVLPHKGRYHWFVIPYSWEMKENVAVTLKKGAFDFTIKPYVPLKLGAAEEPSYLYAWGRYWTSYIDYLGKNYDVNGIVYQKLYAGTGELALGYWHRKSQFGLLTHASLSGFLIHSTTYNYGHLGADVGYRMMFEHGGRLRFWGGISYYEFPELIRDPYNNPEHIDYHRIKNYGPQFQVSYMDQFTFNPDYGWHAYLVAYYGAVSMGTPNGLPAIPQWSYTAGLFATWKRKVDEKWMIGYSFKQENARYKTLDHNGIDNSTLTQGHFLNLSIELGLTKDHYK